MLMLHNPLISVVLLTLAGLVTTSIVFQSGPQNRMLCSDVVTTFRWQYTTNHTVDMVYFLKDGVVFLTYFLRTGVSHNQQSVARKTNVVSISQNEATIRMTNLGTWDSGTYMIMLPGDEGGRYNYSHRVDVFNEKDLIPTLKVDNQPKQLNTTVSLEELDNNFHISITTPNKLLANITILINGKPELVCMRNTSCTYHGVKNALSWHTSNLATIYMYLDYGFCQTIRAQLKLVVMPVPPSDDFPASADFTMAPGNQDVCVSDTVTFHWKYNTTPEVKTAVFWRNQGPFLTYYLGSGDRRTEHSPANRTEIILANQNDITIRIRDIQIIDSGKYELFLVGPSSRNSHRVSVFDRYDLLPVLKVNNQLVALNSNVSLRDDMSTSVCHVSVTSAHHLTANITILVNGEEKEKCSQVTGCVYAGEKEFMAGNNVVTIRLEYGFCDIIQAEITVIGDEPNCGLFVRWGFVLNILLVIVCAALLLLLVLCIRRKTKYRSCWIRGKCSGRPNRNWEYVGKEMISISVEGKSEAEFSLFAEGENQVPTPSCEKLQNLNNEQIEPSIGRETRHFIGGESEEPAGHTDQSIETTHAIGGPSYMYSGRIIDLREQ